MYDLSNHTEKKSALFTLGMFLAILAYSVTFVELRGMSAYVVPAVIWLLAAVLLAKSTIMIRNSIKDKLFVILLTLLSLRFTTDVITGLSLGFGLNLLSVSVTNIVINILRTLPMIIALESLRTTLTFRIDKLWGSRKRALLIIATTLAMALAYVPITRLLSLLPLTTGGTVQFIVNRLFPLLVESAVLTTLAYIGGAIFPIVYMSLVKAYIFIMPVLPVQQGHIKPLAYMLMSLLQLAILWATLGKRMSFREVYNSLLSKRTGMLKRVIHVATTAFNIIIAGGILFLLVTGGRSTVVTSGSMSPTLNVGDIVVVTPTQNLQNDTIAVYVGERSLVIHRIVSVTVRNNGTVLYIFKGDANDDIDPNPVPREHIVGKMLFKIPLLGLPVVLLTESVGGFSTMSALLISLTVLLYTLMLESEVTKLW